MYGQQLADVYEAIYRSRGKDWSEEADYVSSLIRSRRETASSLLDVACGTGAHLQAFGERFADVSGLEVAPAMRNLAVRRLPDTTVYDGDMRDFALGRVFDAVTCMFCSIAYLSTVAEMRSAIAAMVHHVPLGGVVVVEPWWFPEHFIDGYVAGDLSQEEGRTITRVSYSTCRGNTTVMQVHFTVADASGIQEFTEVDLLTLFAREDYVRAFEAAGCRVEFLEGAPTGRGVFIGVRQE